MTSEPHIDGATLLARMPPPALQLARSVCSRLAEGGHRGWIVGGAVRDLVLERPLVDLDLVSDALPDAVEGLFERTVSVGKSFGVVVVVMDFMSQVQTHLLSHQYESLMKKSNLQNFGRR